jgi:glycosyltransferase 2 family protein
LQVFKFDPKSFIDKILQLDLKFFALASFFSVLTIVTNTYRWWIITKGFNYRISYWTGLLWYFEGMFANNFLPSNVGGDALRAFYLGNNDETTEKSKQQHNWLSAGLTVILERLFGFIMMFFFFPLSLIFIYSQNLVQTMPEKLIQALFVLSIIPFLAFFGYKIWIKIPIPFAIFQKIKIAVTEFIVHKRSVCIVLLWTFITHVFLMAINVFSALALGVTEIPFWYWFLVVPLATLASYVIPAVKGLGAREATYVFLLSIIGVSFDQSFAIAVTVFLATLVSSVPGITLVRKGREIFSIIK